MTRDRFAIASSGFTVRYFGASRVSIWVSGFSIPHGSITAVLGPSGSGKTTLAHFIGGILAEHSGGAIMQGEVVVLGTPFRNTCPISHVPQCVSLLQAYECQLSGITETLQEELELTLGSPNISEGRSVLTSLLRDLGLRHLTQRNPMTLSGGEMQKASLASMVALKPELLILDEPFTALDTRSLGEVVNVLRRGYARTVLFTDSRVEAAMRCADFVFVLGDDGKQVFFGSRQEFLRRLGDFDALLRVDTWIAAINHARLGGLGRRLSKFLGTRP